MLLVAVIGVAFVLLVPLAVRPSVTLRRAGRLFALLAIVVVPIGAGFAGLSEHVERAKTVSFCTSCHVMERYGQSLHIDDLAHLPATHYQYNRVPRENACFTCHTDYTMFGDYKAKLRGLRHVWIQYFGTIPAKIHLYTPFRNRECLHCHEGARSFVESVTHKSEPDRLASIRNESLSCLSKGCHDTTHDVDQVGTLASWPAREEKKP
jgi:cytochrome c-type protein NapC